MTIFRRISAPQCSLRGQASEPRLATSQSNWSVFLAAVPRDWFFWLIGPVVFVSRWLTVSAPYFADGPQLIQAAKNHSYVIQPPGYWLYARMAALFSDPGFGLSVMNIVLSSVGVVTFYMLCLHLTTRVAARLAAAAYASIYFAWFAGSTQSSYAAELLFPPLMLLFMLQYMEGEDVRRLVGVALSYALAAGVRPSEGAFLAPLFVYFNARYIRGLRHRILTICLAGLLCLGWYVPQKIALSKVGNESNREQLWKVAGNTAPILHGLSKQALSGVVRTVFPLTIAFWSLLPAIIASRENPVRRMLWIWLTPGIAFFSLVYMSDATYLCFLVPAIILLALTARSNVLTYVGLGLCFISNVLFFCLARPVDYTRSLGLAVYSVSGPRYCAWALKHQWYRRLETYTDVPLIGSGRIGKPTQ